MLLIGGKNEKDFIRRTLTTTFTDNLTSMCSWTRQKNNFEIGNTHTMLDIKSNFLYMIHSVHIYTHSGFHNYLINFFI